MTPQMPIFPDRMNATDALFWSMDAIPEMRSTIGALLVLERAPSRESLRSEFDRMSETLVRMRQRVVEVPFGLAPPEWVEDPQYDPDFHLRWVAIPQPGDLTAAMQEVAPFYATAFDRDRPLWEAYVLEGMNGGRGAVFLKLHHCMLDGVGGTQMSEQLMARHPFTPRLRRRPAERSTSAAALLWRALLYNAGDAAQTGGQLARSLLSTLRAPGAAMAQVSAGLRAAMGFGDEILVPRAETRLHAERSLSRQLTTFAMSIAEIDAVRARLQATNNDVVLTVVSGAMHRWHSTHGEDVPELRALVPVNLRRADDAAAGNRIALLAVPLPTGEPNPVRRLRLIQQRMGRVKSDGRASLYPFLARAMTALPSAVAAAIARQQMRRANFVCTNVPGPRQMQYLAGIPIEAVYPYAPLVGDHPVAIALLSYEGTMFVGIDVDSMAMEDLPVFEDALRESYAQVVDVGTRAEGKAIAAPPRRRVRAAAAH